MGFTTAHTYFLPKGVLPRSVIIDELGQEERTIM